VSEIGPKSFGAFEKRMPDPQNIGGEFGTLSGFLRKTLHERE